MNLKFNPVLIGIITGILILLKLFVPGFMLTWLWVLAPLWVVAGFICALALFHAVVKGVK